MPPVFTERLHGVVTFGDEKHAPAMDQIGQALQKPETQLAVNLMGIRLEDRPNFFSGLLTRLLEIRLQTGRPHWIVIDEAHHMLPSEWVPASAASATELSNVILSTVHPSHIAPAALRRVNVVIAFGNSPQSVIREFADITGFTAPDMKEVVDTPHALLWMLDSQQVGEIQLVRPASQHQRHKRNYAVGELGEDRSFYFRGPEGKLNLRAQNLMLFLQLADGVDDETWEFHLRRGDYSTWFRDALKDGDLANKVQEIERDSALEPSLSRDGVRNAIQQRYTAPS